MNHLVDVILKYAEFLQSHHDEIQARSRDLKVPKHSAAAALFAMEEVRQSGVERVSLGITRVDSHSQIDIKIQQPFDRRLQIMRLEVPSEVAKHFRLVDAGRLKVGSSSVFFLQGATWPVLVSEVTVAVWLEGTFLRMVVENLDCDPHEFTGVVVCWKL